MTRIADFRGIYRSEVALAHPADFGATTIDAEISGARGQMVASSFRLRMDHFSRPIVSATDLRLLRDASA